MKRSIATVILALAATACGDDPTWVQVVDQIESEGAYTTVNQELESLDSLSEVRGDAGHFVGSSIISLADVVAVDRGLAKTRFISNTKRPEARFLVEDGVAIAKDFDTLAMFSAYAHLEEAREYFVNLGVTTEATAATAIYFNPQIVGAAAAGVPETDNAAFFFPADAFLLLPNRRLQDIPLPMNGGIMAHEYAHRVFYYEFWGGDMYGSWARNKGSQEELSLAINRLRSADEGVADYFGARVTGDPHFAHHSTGHSHGRDLEAHRVLDESWTDGREPMTVGAFYDPYAAGSVLASALWHMGESIGFETVDRALLSALRKVGEKVRSHVRYEIGDLEQAIVDELGADHKHAACHVLAKKLQANRRAF